MFFSYLSAPFGPLLARFWHCAELISESNHQMHDSREEEVLIKEAESRKATRVIPGPAALFFPLFFLGNDTEFHSLLLDCDSRPEQGTQRGALSFVPTSRIYRYFTSGHECIYALPISIWHEYLVELWIMNQLKIFQTSKFRCTQYVCIWSFFLVSFLRRGVFWLCNTSTV